MLFLLCLWVFCGVLVVLALIAVLSGFRFRLSFDALSYVVIYVVGFGIGGL